MDNISIKDLYKLFFGKKIVDLTKIESETNLSVTKKPKTMPTDQSSNPKLLTPISKAIYDTTSPRSKPYILLDMLKNNEAINTEYDIHDTLDPDYQEKM